MPEVKKQQKTKEKPALRTVQAAGVIRSGFKYEFTVKLSGQEPRHFKGTTQEEFDRDLEAATAVKAGTCPAE